MIVLEQEAEFSISFEFFLENHNFEKFWLKNHFHDFERIEEKF